VIPPARCRRCEEGINFGGTADPCGTGRYDDHDDVAFAITYTPNASYDSTLRGARVQRGEPL
jgi:hypothetical protein